MRLSLVLVLSLLCARARAADDRTSGKYHLAQAERLASEGKAYEAAEEAQKAYWLDASLKPQADALLAKVHGGKGVDLERGYGEGRPLRTFAWALAGALLVGWLASKARVSGGPTDSKPPTSAS